MVMTTFKAHRSNPELVMPASPTPQGSKTLSDVDSQIPLWFYATVTRFKCGGFAIGVSICHNMADAYGVIQFLKCVTDLARGQEHPAVLPVWDRELLMVRNPPDLTSLPFFVSDEPSPPVQPMAMDKMVGDYFLFGPREIAALRSQVTEPATDFELITAAMWMCRAEAIALALGIPIRSGYSRQEGSYDRRSLFD
ncbi:unnamed protein product [Miscanthus lutarioriparius]|uniref:Uncharacterized protein n=1 Tax=Miscanthus lutarioriparius TaxID=422564 RepID=A0A811MT32_9POAL|nr:unnamed protein product [Miscanthus lutarioriparius]